MENVHAVEPEGDLTRWTHPRPRSADTVPLETRIVQDREGELIAWRVDRGLATSTPKARSRSATRPPDRGTEVEAIIAYVPPGGELGRWVAKMFQARTRRAGPPRAEAPQDADGDRRDRHRPQPQEPPEENPMRALTWHGKHDVRVDTVPDPEIVNPRDAIIEVTSTAICGSDLHLYDGVIPGMLAGDILGPRVHGRVVETGPKSTLKKGQRVVVPFTISCGKCFFCENSSTRPATTPTRPRSRT